MYGGYCFFNNAAIAAHAIAARTGERVAHPRRRLPPRQRHAADLLAARRRPLRLDPRRPGAAVPVLPRPCRRDRRGGGARREPEPAAPGRRRPTPTTSRRWTARSRRSRRARLGHRRVARLRHLRAGPDRRLRPDDATSTTRSGGGSPRWVAGWSSSRRAATTGRRSARTRGPGCAARRAAPSSRCRRPGSGRRGRSPADADRGPSAFRRTIPAMSSPTDLPEHVRSLVDEIETEIGEAARPSRSAPSRAAASARGQRPGRGGGPPDPDSRSARIPTGRACSGRRSGSTGCTPS